MVGLVNLWLQSHQAIPAKLPEYRQHDPRARSEDSNTSEKAALYLPEALAPTLVFQ